MENRAEATVFSATVQEVAVQRHALLGLGGVLDYQRRSASLSG